MLIQPLPGNPGSFESDFGQPSIGIHTIHVNCFSGFPEPAYTHLPALIASPGCAASDEFHRECQTLVRDFFGLLPTGAEPPLCGSDISRYLRLLQKVFSVHPVGWKGQDLPDPGQ